VPRDALGVIYQVGSSTIGRAIGEIRPLLAERGFVVSQRQACTCDTLADVFAYAEAENVTLRIDGTETDAVGRARPPTAASLNPGRFSLAVQPGAPSSRSASSTIRPSGPRT
jgi:hypothetical protein